jgi:hypothetical protein
MIVGVSCEKRPVHFSICGFMENNEIFKTVKRQRKRLKQALYIYITCASMRIYQQHNSYKIKIYYSLFHLNCNNLEEPNLLEIPLKHTRAKTRGKNSLFVMRAEYPSCMSKTASAKVVEIISIYMGQTLPSFATKESEYKQIKTFCLFC